MLKLTPELVNQIAAEYTDGTVIPLLAFKYGVSKTTISKALNSAGITPERKDKLFQSKRMPRKLQGAIVADYRNGLGVYELEVKYSVNHVLVADILEQYEVREKRRYQRSQSETQVLALASGKRVLLSTEDQGKLCTEYTDTDVTKTQLATKWQVSVETVERILERWNISTKRQVSAEVVDEMSKEYEAGFVTPHDLAKIHNISPSSVKYHLSKQGIEMENHAKVVSMGVPAGRVRKLCREASEDVINEVIAIVMSPASEDRDKIAAAKLLLERGWGKPKDEVEPEESSSGGSAPSATGGAKIMKLMPPEQLKQILGGKEEK